jgi:uncharacterized protein YjbI with pentapeptide repeats
VLTPDISSGLLRQEKWWSDWRRVDFSWGALARHRLESLNPSSDDATLQDYWRKEPLGTALLTDEALLAAGEIEKDPAGRLWHIAHVPAAWEGGSPTWKANPNHENWPRFWELLKKRIFALQRTQFALADEEESAQEKAQLAGVVFGQPPDDWEWHDVFDSLKIDFATCAFLDEVDFGGVSSHSNLNFRYCLFLGRAGFDRLNIDGGVDLSDSTFIKHLSLCNGEISGGLKASRVHCFGEVAVLDSEITGTTEIDGSVFYGPSGFEETKFKGEVTVSYCRFLSLVSMAKTTFGQDAKFLECLYSSEDITFTGECCGDFYLLGCTLEHSDFAYLQFRKAAYFSATRFRQSANFQNTDFHGKVSFRNSIFESDATFQDVTFQGPMEFHNTIFGGVADLSRCLFPQDPSFFHAGFRGAEFRRVADFTNPAFFAWAAFPGTKFHQPVLFSPAVLRSDASFKKALASAKQISGSATDDQHLAELESAFQTLKAAMANQQARLEEQRFYRFELIARRKQTRTPLFERIFSVLYAATSIYGTSLVLPAVWLVGITIAFAFIYWAMTRPPADLLASLWPFPLRPMDESLINALTFSAHNVFQPFSAWAVPSGDSSSELWAKAFLTTGGPLHDFATRLLATLQSLLSPILLFLSALAIKRRFQIT